MSDQGRHDTEDRDDRPKVKRWGHDDKVDSWRDGWRSCLEMCRETLDEYGAEKLADMVRRATRR